MSPARQTWSNIKDSILFNVGLGQRVDVVNYKYVALRVMHQ